MNAHAALSLVTSLADTAWQRRVEIALSLCAAWVLSACGGGGGASGTSIFGGGGGGGGGAGLGNGNAFAALNQTTNPPGARIDVMVLNLFPFNNGDRVVFDRTAAGAANGSITRTVSAPTAGSLYVVTETDSSSAPSPDITRYVVTASGNELHIQIQDPLGAAASKPGLFSSLPVLDEYVAPLYPVGGIRRRESQGDLGADIDGDGKSDSFRFEYTQIFRGFESADVLGSIRQLAHFSNASTFTLRGTAGRPDSVVTRSEETYFAPNIGMVRRDFSAILSNGAVTVPAYSMQARSALVGSRPYP
jgi:hypothetical protein